MYEQTSGSQHRWYYTIPLSLFSNSFKSSFEEFKVVSMVVKYIPNNSLNETGLYASVLLDRDGFGSFGTATAIQWFQYIGSMPGAIIRPRHTSTSHRWKPTEPTARDWTRGNIASTMRLATIYLCNNGKETEELGGLLDIKATLLVRGRYWNAAVQHPIFRPSTPTYPPPGDAPPSTSAFFEPPIQGMVHADEPRSEPTPMSRSSSRASLIGGFLAL